MATIAPTSLPPELAQISAAERATLAHALLEGISDADLPRLQDCPLGSESEVELERRLCVAAERPGVGSSLEEAMVMVRVESRRGHR